jgi:hypothetical protein
VSAEENANILMNHPFFTSREIAEQIAEPNSSDEKNEQVLKK